MTISHLGCICKLQIGLSTHTAYTSALMIGTSIRHLSALQQACDFKRRGAALHVFIYGSTAHQLMLCLLLCS